MAVTLTGSNGLFTRLGKLFQIAVQVKSFQATLATEIQDALDEFDGGDNDHALALTDVKLSSQKSCAAVYNAIRTVAHKTLIEMVNDDDPLTSKTLSLAIDRLIKQMEDGSASINASAYGAPDTADSGNTGNGTILATTSALTKSTANTRAESLVIKCTKDSQVTGTAGREVFTITGEAPISDIMDPDWPGGSGASVTVTVTDPAVDASSQLNKNLLTNSSFESFSTNTPSNWTIATGTAGTHVYKNTTTAKIFQGDANLKITGDGSNLTKLTQQLNTSGGTAGKLLPNTVYFLTYKYYLDSGVAAGVLKVSLEDAGGTEVTNNGLTASSTINLSAASHSQWNTSSTFFKTPEALSTNTPYQITLELTTAMTNTKSAYIDQLCVAKAVQVGNGPYVAILRGTTDFVKDDQFVIAVAKSSTGTMQENFDKFFNMYSRGKQLPEHTGGSETIADSLIA
ncbi:MAG: hypothetical protein Tp1124DCM412911_13 [Prokaryotic dsDNA virus sp.]|nr:MAG: hypothetical protein Tp1124DCM412911_13 [Prokaryotic dsDNA virus sp.]|tara:strand:+ start:19389 stop:20756 length:1368 start_codon:yes stop_codon:yes gene_type:complete